MLTDTLPTERDTASPYDAMLEEEADTISAPNTVMQEKRNADSAQDTMLQEEWVPHQLPALFSKNNILYYLPMAC